VLLRQAEEDDQQGRIQAEQRRMLGVGHRHAQEDLHPAPHREHAGHDREVRDDQRQKRRPDAAQQDQREPGGGRQRRAHPVRRDAPGQSQPPAAHPPAEGAQALLQRDEHQDSLDVFHRLRPPRAGTASARVYVRAGAAARTWP